MRAKKRRGRRSKPPRNVKQEVRILPKLKIPPDVVAIRVADFGRCWE
jgi:hypothetical protein